MHTLTVSDTEPNTLHARGENVGLTLRGAEALLVTPEGEVRLRKRPPICSRCPREVG